MGRPGESQGFGISHVREAAGWAGDVGWGGGSQDGDNMCGPRQGTIPREPAHQKEKRLRASLGASQCPCRQQVQEWDNLVPREGPWYGGPLTLLAHAQ